MNESKHEQLGHSCPGNAKSDANGNGKHEGRICIPSESITIKGKVIVSVPCGEQDDTAYKEPLKIMSESFWWQRMSVELKDFVKSCMHCIISQAGEKIPIPLANALHCGKLGCSFRLSLHRKFESR